MKNEGYATEIRSWLAEMAMGAKAMARTMICADAEDGYEWKIKAYSYEHDQVVIDGVITVYIHRIENVAKGAGLKLHHRDFIEGDHYFSRFSGEDFVMFNDVKFSDMILRTEEKNDRE